DRDVAVAGSLPGALECLLDPTGHKVERRSALHLQGFAGVVGEHEHGRVVRRVVAPPAVPGFVAPRAADRPEHVATHDRGARALAPVFGVLVVEPGLAALPALHLSKCAGHERPLVEFLAAFAERILGAL